MNSIQILSLVIFLITYFFIAIEKTPKVYVSIIGLVLLVLLGIYKFDEVHSFIDWNTVVFLFGIFTVVKIIEISGYFNYFALKIIKKFKYDPVKIFLFFPFFSWFLSGFIGSITVLTFLSPLTYTLCKIIKIDPIPLIVAEVVLSNIGGAGTLMGDPPNVIFGSMFHLGFTPFFINNYIVSLISGFSAISVFYKMNKKNLMESRKKIDERIFQKIIPEEAIEDKILAKYGLLGLVGVVFLLIFRDLIHNFFHLSIGICSILPTLIVLSLKGSHPKLKNIFKEIDIETIIFFIALFGIVGALEKTELIKQFSYNLKNFASNGLKMNFVLFWFSAFSSAFIDNVPEAMSIGLLIKNITPFINYSFRILVWCASLGLDLGGNFTPIGASANVVAYGFLESQDIKVGWKKWIKLSFLPNFISVIIAYILVHLKFIFGFY